MSESFIGSGRADAIAPEDLITGEACPEVKEVPEEAFPEEEVAIPGEEPAMIPEDAGRPESDDDDLPPGVSPDGLRRALRARHTAQIAEDMRLRSHYRQLTAQAQALKSRYPDFDLAREMRNPVFARLTAPGVGVDPETAYEVVHRRSLAEAARRQAAADYSRAVSSHSLRPIENALSGALSGPSVRPDPRNLSPEARADIRARVSRGEKITF